MKSEKDVKFDNRVCLKWLDTIQIVVAYLKMSRRNVDLMVEISIKMIR